MKLPNPDPDIEFDLFMACWDYLAWGTEQDAAMARRLIFRASNEIHRLHYRLQEAKLAEIRALGT